MEEFKHVGVQKTCKILFDFWKYGSWKLFSHFWFRMCVEAKASGSKKKITKNKKNACRVGLKNSRKLWDKVFFFFSLMKMTILHSWDFVTLCNTSVHTYICTSIQTALQMKTNWSFQHRWRPTNKQDWPTLPTLSRFSGQKGKQTYIFFRPYNVYYDLPLGCTLHSWHVRQSFSDQACNQDSLLILCSWQRKKALTINFLLTE